MTIDILYMETLVEVQIFDVNTIYSLKFFFQVLLINLA